MDNKQRYTLARDKYTKAVSEEQTQQVREKIIESNRFARIPGTQWEGSTFAGTDLLESLDKYPKFELNKVAKEVDRIISEQSYDLIHRPCIPENIQHDLRANNP